MNGFKEKYESFRRKIKGHQALLEKGKSIVNSILEYHEKEHLDIFSIETGETSFTVICNNLKFFFRLEIPFSPPHETEAESKLTASVLRVDENHKKILEEIKCLETIFDQIGNVNKAFLLNDYPEHFFWKLIQHLENHKELIKY